MNKMFFHSTVLSILLFASISFFTILMQINPTHTYQKEELYSLNVGFPFVYYRQFWVSGANIPNAAWNSKSLFFDIGLTWLVVFVYGKLKKMV